ncbi:unnamed protein product [Spirodela intermedia]|uniref:Uncharacterized protein n=1 Tax=Spirodela intermedia TaxID=51605 RepID=A0A7I8KDU8_SPIIN|nr:unnamed protein product [Spirodela intermedia]
MSPANSTNIASWLVIGAFFNFFVFRHQKGWWQRYNYVLLRHPGYRHPRFSAERGPEPAVPATCPTVLGVMGGSPVV